jgi:hypothetical protein
MNSSSVDPAASARNSDTDRGPSLRLALITAAFCSVAAALYGAAQVEPLPIVGIVLTAAPVIAVILWVQADARRTGVAAVLDLGLFLWLTWPATIPWYVFKTRGRGGWKLVLGLLAICLSVYVAGGLAAWLVYD